MKNFDPFSVGCVGFFSSKIKCLNFSFLKNDAGRTSARLCLRENWKLCATNKFISPNGNLNRKHVL